MNKTKRAALSRLDTNSVLPAKPISAAGPVPSAVELGDVGDHIKKLKQVSATARCLMSLLEVQLQELSVSIPISRAFEIISELRGRSNTYHEGLKESFEPLRTYIEHKKALFYTEHADAIEKIVRQRVEEGVKQRFPAVLEEQLGRYEECVKTNHVLLDKVRQAMGTMFSRAANSILSPNYPDEHVSLIPPRPEWNGLTLGNLRTIRGPAVARLMVDQGLTPLQDLEPELARVRNLNVVLQHLNIQYRAIPSRNGILLTSVIRQRNH